MEECQAREQPRCSLLHERAAQFSISLTSHAPSSHHFDKKEDRAGAGSSRRRVISQVDGSRPQDGGRHGRSSAPGTCSDGKFGPINREKLLKAEVDDDSAAVSARPGCGCLPGMSDGAARSLGEREGSALHANERPPKKVAFPHLPPPPPSSSHRLHLAPRCLALDTCKKKICKVWAAGAALFNRLKKKKKEEEEVQRLKCQNKKKKVQRLHPSGADILEEHGKAWRRVKKQ